jgi:hypothetical protein
MILSTIVEKFETFAKLFAEIAAGLFFLWKLLTGWLIINLSVSVEASRQRDSNVQPSSSEIRDFLNIKLKLSKGNTDTLMLREVELRLWECENGKPSSLLSTIPIGEIEKLPLPGAGRQQTGNHGNAQKLTLSPGESVEYGRTAIVPADRIILVEAIVTGYRTFWQPGFEWRCSTSSSPMK